MSCKLTGLRTGGELLLHRGGWSCLDESTALSLACPAAPYQSRCLALLPADSSGQEQDLAAWEPGSSEPAAGGGGVGHVCSSSVGTPAGPGAAEPRTQATAHGESRVRGAEPRLVSCGVEQVRFRFLRAAVCCAFVVTVTALLGWSTVLGRLPLFLMQPGKGSPGGGCDLVQSPRDGQELRERLHRFCDVGEEHEHGSLLSSPGAFPF